VDPRITLKMKATFDKIKESRDEYCRLALKYRSALEPVLAALQRTPEGWPPFRVLAAMPGKHVGYVYLQAADGGDGYVGYEVDRRMVGVFRELYSRLLEDPGGCVSRHVVMQRGGFESVSTLRRAREALTGELAELICWKPGAANGLYLDPEKMAVRREGHTAG
jgi:hypothetical protein